MKFMIPRALELDEITVIIEQFGKGAQKAKDAGFDGVFRLQYNNRGNPVTGQT
jgi:hypothetical protein